MCQQNLLGEGTKPDVSYPLGCVSFSCMPHSPVESPKSGEREEMFPVELSRGSPRDEKSTQKKSSLRLNQRLSGKHVAELHNSGSKTFVVVSSWHAGVYSSSALRD